MPQSIGTCILCGNPVVTAANMCLSCFTRSVTGITSGARSAAGAQSFANQYQGVYGTNGFPSYSNKPYTADDDDSFVKLKERMLSTKLIPVREFDELILILLPLLDQEVIDFLWWEFEPNWSPLMYSWAGMQRASSPQPFFWQYALAQERNKRELAEFDAREALRKEKEEFERTKNMNPDNLRAYQNQLLKPETYSDKMKEFERKYLSNKRKGVI